MLSCASTDLGGVHAVIVELSASSGYVCARTDRGTVRCSGSFLVDRREGPLSTPIYPAPDARAGVELLTGVTAIGTNPRFACGVASGHPLCWGLLERGFNSVSAPAPTSVSQILNANVVVESVVAVVGGARDLVCVIGGDSQVTCSGGFTLPPAAVDVAAGAQVCAIIDDGITPRRLMCTFGQAETVVAFSSPVVPESLDKSSAACAVATDHRVYCLDYRRGPTWQVVDGLDDVRKTASFCAIRSDGSVWCWGSNSAGQLGRGYVSQQTDVAAAPVVSLPNSAIDVVTGSGFACALTAKHEVWCWGSNEAHQLGVDGQESSVPILVLN